MRICYILNGYGINPAGGVRIVYKHARLLRDRGHIVFVIHPSKPYNIYKLSNQEDDSKRASNLLSLFIHKIKNYLNCYEFPRQVIFMIRMIILKMKIPDLPITSMKLVPELHENYLPGKVDALVATWWETAYFVHLVKRKDIRSKYFLCQGYETWGGPEDLVNQAYEFKDLRLISVSRWIHDEIKKYHNRESSIVVNGMIYDSFIPKTKKWDSTIKIGYIYRGNCSFKGYQSFKTVNSILCNDKSFKFIVAGYEPPDDKELKCLYVNTNSSKRMRKFYEIIDVLLYPSESEGFGLPIIESMACGTPVISTPVGIAPDIIIDETNSFMTSDFNPDSLLAKIKKFASLSPEEKSKISNNAITVANTFQWEKQILLLENIYSEG